MLPEHLRQTYNGRESCDTDLCYSGSSDELPCRKLWIRSPRRYTVVGLVRRVDRTAGPHMYAIIKNSFVESLARKDAFSKESTSQN